MSETAKQRNHGNGSGNKYGYKIEVRSTHWPRSVGKLIIDREWRTLPIYEGSAPLGPTTPVSHFDRDLLEHGLLSRNGAEAQRFGFLAALEAADIGSSLCIETRLIKCEYR